VTADDPRDALEHAALRFAVVHAAVPMGDASQELLRERRRNLLAAAAIYCAATGHRGEPPPT